MEEVMTWVEFEGEEDEVVEADWMRDWERLFRLAARATSTKMSSWPSAQRLIDDAEGVKGDFQLIAASSCRERSVSMQWVLTSHVEESRSKLELLTQLRLCENVILVQAPDQPG
jgi:hypothetical protein